jgi:hypothetical protein
MIFEDFFVQSGPATILVGVVTIVISLNTVFFRWLSNNFTSLKHDIEENAKKYSSWLTTHEEKDQGRHEDNLYRFEKISVALARLGSNNGTHQ